jgi:membrane associated rhomboid family serine protease
MGIYDREYYRRESPSFFDRGQVCKWLIGVNVACFIIQVVTRPPGGAPSWFTNLFWLDADKVLHGEVWRLLTYAFLHDTHDILHIVFNMLFLWWFGSDVEDIYGSREFLTVYLLSAFLGGVAFCSTYWLGWTFGSVCMGASGAVTAVMVLCALHYPTRTILLFFIVPVPIWLFVGFQVLQDTWSLLSQDPNNRTAVSVHLAGAAFAFTYYKRHWRVLRWWAQLQSFLQQRTRPRLRIYREEPRPQPPTAAPREEEADEQLEAKLDAVLEKVARYGQNSLTEGERRILLRASEVYKRRRT